LREKSSPKGSPHPERQMGWRACEAIGAAVTRSQARSVTRRKAVQIYLTPSFKRGLIPSDGSEARVPEEAKGVLALLQTWVVATDGLVEALSNKDVEP
jgi:hypothetical protein